MHAPAVSIIIPVGPRHGHYLPDALQSVFAQSLPSWEALVINQAGVALPHIPRVRVLPAPDYGQYEEGVSRTAINRNAAIAQARGAWVLPLDADDYLMPRAIEQLLRGALAHPEASYIYGGWYNLRPGSGYSYAPPPEYDRARVLHGSIHPVTALYPTEVLREIGGFDPSWIVYEDWELQVRLAVRGHCGTPIPAPVLVYRNAAGSNRNESLTRAERDGEPALRRLRYGAYLNGERALMGCCGGNRRAQQAAQAAVGGLPALGAMMETAMAGETVRMRYAADLSGNLTFRNPFGGSGKLYRIGPGNMRYVAAEAQDVAWLKERGFELVPRPQIDPPPALPALLATPAGTAEGPPPIIPAVEIAGDESVLVDDGEVARPRRAKKEAA